jgi:hypothetical protein
MPGADGLVLALTSGEKNAAMIPKGQLRVGLADVEDDSRAFHFSSDLF